MADILTADPMPTLYVGAGSGRVPRWLLSNGIPCAAVDNSPDAIELMGRRGIPCELMDACAMTFADDSHERVILHSDGLMDSFEDPADCIAEAARVASSRVLVMGYEIDPAATVPCTWGLTWQGQTVSDTYHAHPVAKIEAILQAVGMVLVSRVMWSDDEAPEGGNYFGVQYLIEARW